MPITDNSPPPKTTAATARPRATKSSALTQARTEALTGLGQLAQVPLIATRQFADAGAVSAYWPNISKEVAKLAEDNEQIARLVDPLMQVGPYAGLVTAVLPFILQIAVNHKRLSAGAMGTVPAESLAAQVESSLAQQEMQALQVQLQSEREAAALREQILKQRQELILSQNENA